MNINPNIFKAYDLRGIYPKDINEETIVVITKAIYQFFLQKLQKDSLSVVLGRDMRTSTPQLFEIVKTTLMEHGAEVVDGGLLSTPSFYYATLNYGYDTGIMITASHNPKEWNGLKFVIRQDKHLLKIGKPTGMEDVKELAVVGEFKLAKKQGSLKQLDSAIKDEVESAIKTVGLEKIKDFKIVTDTANGMAITYLDEFFSHFPAQVIKMNDKLDGTFPAHEANPLKFETLKDLQEEVLEEQADFGIAPDADGDRIFFIDEKGEVIPATMITSMIADEILSEMPTESIIVDIRYLRNVQQVVKRFNAPCLITKVGHAFITEMMIKEGSFFAGESSGHFFFRSTGGAESSVMVLAYLLKIIQKKNKPLSEIVKEYHTSYESGEFNFKLSPSEDVKKVLEQFAQSHKEGERSDLDGLSISYPNWRFNIRTSNTEPLMRLNIEAESESLMQEKLKELLATFQALGAEKE